MPVPPDDPRTTAPSGDTHQANGPSAWADDLALVRRVLAGEPDDLKEFTRRMAVLPPFLASRNRAFGRPIRDADLPDLIQDALVIVWRRLDSFAGRSAVETWACGIALFELRNAARRRQRRQRHERPLADGELGAAPEPGPVLDVEALQLALAELPASDVDLLSLKHHDELSFPELGQRLQLSTSGAKNRYYRILERLRRRLGRSADGEARP